MSEEKNSSEFLSVAGNILSQLKASGLSKTDQKKALQHVATEYGLRVVPVGVAIATPQVSARPAPKGKGPSTKQKDPVNLDPRVLELQKELDRLTDLVRKSKSSPEGVPEALLKEKSDVLTSLKAAKAAARSNRQ